MLEILLAEDNLGDVLLVKNALATHNISHHLHIVRDGAQAIDYVTRMGTTKGLPCPDLLLLDLNLPKVDGQSVLSEFRKRPECANTPVIVVTSSDAQKDRVRMASLGVTRYFRKPLDFEEFLHLGAMVREVVEERSAL